jgi:membrane protein YqaA with SNARE-associated domain
LSDVTGPIAVTVPPGAAERLPDGTRWWFGGFVVWMLLWAGLAVWLLEGGVADERWGLRAGLLALMCFYLSLCNSFVPLPTAWIVMLAAADDYALVEHGWLRVVVVSLLATTATVVANLNEYHLMSYLLHNDLGRRARRTRVYAWAVRWFERGPFQILALIAFVPIPVDAVRWLAILRRYGRARFALAYFVGRGARYVLFAACSVIYALEAWQILVIQAGLVGGALLVRLGWRLWRR